MVPKVEPTPVVEVVAEPLPFWLPLKELEGRTELLEVAKEDELELAEPGVVVPSVAVASTVAAASTASKTPAGIASASVLTASFST